MKKSTITTFIPSLLLSLSLLSACSNIPYRIDVNQGNEISRQSLDKLSIGMSKEEVQLVVGSALLLDAFHQNRWDYIQYYKSGKTGEVQQGDITLYFTNDLLSRIEDSRLTNITPESLDY